jgi:hypothetical protein
MLLPNWETATVDEPKLADHVLNSRHPEGMHKARVFFSALSLSAPDADWLADAILAGLRHAEAMWQADTQWGAIYRANMDILWAKMREDMNGLPRHDGRHWTRDVLRNRSMR